MIGVDYEQFWILNPRKLEPFIKAFSLKQEYDDRMAWLQGDYIRMAIASSMSKKVKYPKRPRTMDKMSPEEKQRQIKERFLDTMSKINKDKGREE